MEDEKFKQLLKDIRLLQQRVYLLTNEVASPIIDKFIQEHPELLEVHDKEWYHKNL
jgi:hypothetical protein